MDKSKVAGLFSRENVFKYTKNLGVASYAGLGIAISQPNIVRVGHVDLTNTVLLGSLVGTGAFIYHQNHLKDVPVKNRIWLSVYGSGLFNLGSLLLWALVKQATEGFNLHPIFRGFLSLAASYYMVLSGLSWAEIIDKSSKN